MPTHITPTHKAETSLSQMAKQMGSGETVIPMHQAKSSLSQLVKRAVSGETIVIGGYGKAEAVLVAAGNAMPKKRLGLLEGKLVIPDDFDAPLPQEILAAFGEDAV